MSLRETVHEIEENFMREKVYIYNEKIVNYYKLQRAVNEIMGNLSGNVYDLYYDQGLGSVIYGLCNEDNKKKYCSLKYEDSVWEEK